LHENQLQFINKL